MIGICLLALALPLAGVIWFLSTLRFSADTPPVDVPQLTAALEEISAKTLAPGTLESGEREAIRLETPNPTERVAGVIKLARSVGGTAFPVTEESGAQRLWVSVPEKRLPAFVEACRAGVEELEYPTAGENDARILLEIVVQQKSP
jgi:hypothetical protein